MLYIYSIYGLVAQWTRARGYEPRCQGFESLLARISYFLTLDILTNPSKLLIIRIGRGGRVGRLRLI